MNPRPYLMMVALFLLSFILRLSLISLGPFSVDCLMLATASEKTLATHHLHYLFDFGYPVAVIMGAVFIGLGKIFFINDPVMSVNVMSVVFSSLCVVLLFDYVRKFFDSTTAFFSAILLCLNPIFLGVSVYGTSHSLSLFFLLMCLRMLLRYHEKQETSFLILSGLSLGLMGSTRTVEMLTVIPALILFIAWGNQWNPIPLQTPPKKIPPYGRHLFFAVSEKNFLAVREFYTFLHCKKTNLIKSGMILFTTALLVMLIFHCSLFLSPYRSIFLSKLYSFIDRDLITNYGGIFSPTYRMAEIYLCQSFTFMGIAFIFAGIVCLMFQNKKKLLFLLLWFIVPYVFFGQLWTVAPRYFLIALIPLIIILSFFLSHFLRKKGAYSVLIFMTYVALIYSLFSFIYPTLLFRHQNSLIINYVLWVKSRTEDNARIIPADEGPFIRYYANRLTLEVFTRYSKLSDEELTDFQNRVTDLLKQNVPVYITEMGLRTYDVDKKFSGFVAEHFRLTSVGQEWTENWHRGELQVLIGKASLFRIHRLFDENRSQGTP